MEQLLEKTSIMEATLDEEDSFYYLMNIVLDDWHSYTSRNRPLIEVASAIETFILLHARVNIGDSTFNRFWSPTPIGVFRYVMDEYMNPHVISEFKPFDGYTVQGCYWSNGFYYLVSNKDFLIEANLYVDLQTKEQYNYQ